jgi:hypothetical protein
MTCRNLPLASGEQSCALLIRIEANISPSERKLSNPIVFTAKSTTARIMPIAYMLMLLGWITVFDGAVAHNAGSRAC